MNKLVFGCQLAYYRRQANMTQEALADRMECAISTISRIESGLQFPGPKLYEKFDRIFEFAGLTYDELMLEDAFALKRAKRELLAAIHVGRAEKLERKLDKFSELMDEKNVEHKQYYVLGNLVYMRKMGLAAEEFIKRTADLFEMGRKMPGAKDLEGVKLTRIEHMIIYKYALGHIEIGNMKVAQELLGGLMKNDAYQGGEHIRKRCKYLSVSLADVFVKLNNLKAARRCIDFSINRVLEELDTRLLFAILLVQQDFFKKTNDKKGERVIDDFLIASQKMVNHLHLKSKEIF